jgi:hypothetical protein
MEIEDFFRDTKVNMYLSWILILPVLAVFVESILTFDIVWIGFSGLILSILVLPAAVHRDFRVMVPWELVLIGSIPVLVRALNISILANQVATYTAMAALALIIAVELNVFTEVTFSHGFAVLFTVIATLAVAGVWAVLRFNADIYLGTSYLTTNEALMEEYINAALAGIIAGIVFDTYFTRRDRKFRKRIRKVISR